MTAFDAARRDIHGREITLDESETVLVNGKPWTISSIRFAVKESVPTGDDREGGQTEA